MAAGAPMCGVFPILVTPFDEAGRVDEESLRRLVEFNVKAGVHGLGVALASEIYKLTEPERDRLIAIVVDQANRRVPIVVNTGAAATDPAVAYSRRAEELGAAALMCTPPAMGLSAREVRSYFRAISDAVRLPIFIQDVPSAPVPAGLIRQIAEESERVRYAKVETAPQPQKVYEAVVQGEGLVAVFGGAAGAFMLEELRRGAVGTMPWPSTPRAFVAVWDFWHSGNSAGARDVFDREIAPLVRVSMTSLGAGHLVHKEALRRQGIMRTAHVRGPVEPLDEVTGRELDEVCARLGWG